MARIAPVPQAREMEMIDRYLEHLRRAGCSDQTRRDRHGILCRLNRDLPYGLGQVSTEELARWLYRPTWSQNTRATYYRAIKSFYAWASDEHDPWISSNPAARLQRVTDAETVPRACTDEQLRRIIAEAREPFRTWAIIAAYAGLRCIEIAGLDRQHVTAQELFVVRGKGGKPRLHDTDPLIWAAVKDLPPGPIARHPDTGDRATAHYVSASAAYHFQQTMKMPKGVSLHKMRHWLGTTVQREFKDPRVTMAILGHKSLKSTQIYTAATDEQQRAARATLPRLAGG
jgi:integrase/recombinase XerC